MLKAFIKSRLDGSSKRVQIGVKLTQGDLDALDSICTSEGFKRQDAIEDAIRDWIADAKKTLAAEGKGE